MHLGIFRQSASVIFDHLGVDAEYHNKAGVVTQIKVIVREGINALPGNYLSEVRDDSTVIDVLEEDAPRISRGELIVIDSVAYTIEDRIDSDGIVNTWSAESLNNG